MTLKQRQRRQTYNESVDPEQGYNSVDPEQGYKSVDPEQGYKSVDPEQGYKSVDPEQDYKSVDPEQGYNQPKFDRSRFDSVREKGNVKVDVFSNEEICQ